MTLTVLSLGAGVQSTTLALMAAHGEITPMPDCAIFADTQWEPKAVYDHLDWLCSPNVLPFPVYRVTAGNIRADILAIASGEKTTGRRATPPLFLKTDSPGGGFVSRQCTEHYKIEPIHKELRRLLGYEKGARIPANSVEVWIGISTDEASRMKPARKAWQTHRWPLIEANMSRGDCPQWLRRHDYPIPSKSSCIGCPFHSDSEWRALKTRPDEWAEAVEVDRAVRSWPSLDAPAYLHRSLVPLDQVAFDRQPDLFGNECEGVCGV